MFLSISGPADPAADALEATADGLLLVDAAERLQWCNAALGDFYRPVAHLLVPRTPLEALLRAVAERGHILDAEGRVAWLQERLARHRRSGAAVTERLADGRTLLVRDRRTQAGGCVTTFTDITELARREAELSQRRP